ncbi:MAG TPA: outer membrane beta-barrel protein [Bacteroidia bacterium]|jgi:hypothetical protein|nr:outer membrane beta-barrel protein [Bacteroidia bacterium]
MRFKILNVCALSCFLFMASTTMKAGDDPKFNIGVSVGAGMPMGAFGKSANNAANDTSHTNGWAKTGFHFDVNASYYFTNNIGGMLMIGGNMNGFNTSAYISANPGTPSTFTAGSYYVGSYLLGPTLRIPLSDKFGITARLLFGLMTVKDSKQSETWTGAGGTSYTTSSVFNSASTFGYDFGAGVKYGLTDNLGLALNVDYLGGSPNFTTYTRTTTPSGSGFPDGTSGGHKINMSTSLVNISIGVVIGF